MAYRATLIAYAFVRKGINEGKPVTQMKLQKMVYFAHGYHLAAYGTPLVEELFEAWKFGPVIQSIYQEFKSFGISSINIHLDKSIVAEINSLDENAVKAIDYTWETTKNINAVALSNWTHKVDSPWQKVYKPNVWGIIIDNNLIKDYFYKFLTV